MQPATYIPIIFLFIVVFIILKRRKSVVAKKIIEKRNKGDKTEMIELAKKFIDKECLIYAFDSNHTFQGVIKEVSNGAVLIENGDIVEAIKSVVGEDGNYNIEIPAPAIRATTAGRRLESTLCRTDKFLKR